MVLLPFFVTIFLGMVDGDVKLLLFLVPFADADEARKEGKA